MTLDPQEMTVSPLAPAVGWRLRRWLLQTYPWPRGKAIARDLGVSLSTAERILSGCDPKLKVFLRMVSLWKEPFLRFVFNECFKQQDNFVSESIEAIRFSYIKEHDLLHEYSTSSYSFRITPLLAVTVLSIRIADSDRTPDRLSRMIAGVWSFVDVRLMALAG